MIVAALIAWGAAAGLTWRFCNPASRLHILDYPNERSLHSRPIPRSGGIAVLSGLLAGGLTLYPFYPIDSGLLVLAAALIPVALVSFLDDQRGVKPEIRILVHLLAAVIMLAGGYTGECIELPGLSWVPPRILMMAILILFVVWMINLYNFMDGMDGFAGGMAVIGFVSFAVLGKGDVLFASACLLVAAAVAGFLVFNLPPARIFLGDVGSSSLGLLVAGFSLWASRDDLFPLWLAVLVFSPFIVDASMTLMRRMIRGDKIWQPHRTHYYQRLVRMGWGHKRTLRAEYVLMLACSLSALWAEGLSPEGQIVLLVFWLLAYSLLMFAVTRLEREAAS